MAIPSDQSGRPSVRAVTLPKRRRWWRILLSVAGALAIVLIAGRIALPYYLVSYVNRVLDQSPEFDGRIGDVEVHLWRGAYSITDVKIVKTSNAVAVPFFESPRVDLALDWAALWQGALRGRILMEKPKLNFVAGPTPEETQTGQGQAWLGMLDDLFPFRIDKFEITDGEVHFHAFHTQPRVNVYLSELRGELKNLTNIEDSLDPLMASVRVRGRAMESGRFELDMNLDPQSHRPTFSLATRLIGMDVRRLNSLARAYGDFDFEEGEFDLVVEATAKEGFIDGYAKPLFRNVQVISLRDVKNKDPLHVLWEAMVSVVGEVFTNQSRDQFGTRITITGDLDNPRTDVMEIVGNVIYNAFVRAYLPRLEGGAAPDLVKPGRGTTTKAATQEPVKEEIKK